MELVATTGILSGKNIIRLKIHRKNNRNCVYGKQQEWCERITGKVCMARFRIGHTCVQLPARTRHAQGHDVCGCETLGVMDA
eukprot:365295-Chlamydomonas_euryale.AAC.2